MVKFINKYSFDERVQTSVKMREKYPERVPIICEPSERCKFLTIELTKIKTKYLSPRDMSLGKFIYSIRQQVNLSPETAIFLFLKDDSIMPPVSISMGLLYDKYGADDGFLYITFSEENTFG